MGGLTAHRTSVDTRTKNLLETITDTREHFHEKLGLMIQSEAQMTKIPCGEARGQDSRSQGLGQAQKRNRNQHRRSKATEF
jgi:hypothetical protein